ncbi:YIEGIA family protein [Gorillibacterium massiliense]|uniref:YIEGIA family protein n=1 Tax=Gorillibacterium massiliense TaxID=1280390 RepID=UPI0004B22CDB|nr:YIEGIA family protein [Gorillibacterium massiliense]
MTDKYTLAILLGVILGTMARFLMMRTDYRQYPTYPHGQIIHVALGIIAAALGAVAVPAILEKQYTAVTFLTLAAQQFRDVRNMEREMLTTLDQEEMVPRGGAYVEGIAMVFEGRNYLVILTAFAASLCTVLLSWYVGVAAGVLCFGLNKILKSGKSLGSIVNVEKTDIVIKGPGVYVGDIYIRNIGLSEARKSILEYGMGFTLKPKGRTSRLSLANPGQRQAILHNLSSILGAYLDTGEPSLIPMAKLDMRDGRLGLLFLSVDQDIERAEQVIRSVPLIENSVRRPSKKRRRKGA